MIKSLVVLAILGTASVSAAAQTAPAADQAAAVAKPQMIKKKVCEKVEVDDPSSRLGARKICKVVEVPAPATGAGTSAPAPKADGQ